MSGPQNAETITEVPDTGLKSTDADWVVVQKKTFTKWVNSHLRKRGATVSNLETDFTDGVLLMKLVHSLFNIPVPKHNANARSKPAQLDNCTIAINLVEKAGVRLHFLKPNHLVDQDLKMILGMIWTIILDFQIKGISVEELTAKEGLLLWCQKKTKGYRDVKVENFTTSWQSGLAFCALIHRHRPDLLDYDKLDKNQAAHNLNLAFDIAEQHLKIPKLLDVEDLLNVARPDERSVMCYISEFFHAFSAQDFKETSARRIQNFVQFHQGIDQLERNYETGARNLLDWINNTIEELNQRTYEESIDHAKGLQESHKNFKLNVKPKKNEERLDVEGLFANINTKLRSNNRMPYTAPAGLSAEDIDGAWHQLENAENARGKALRENVTSQKEKLRQEFAQKANRFHEWLSSTKDLLLHPQQGDLTTQLEFTKGKSEEIQSSPEYLELEEIQRRMEAAGIDDNPHTEYSFEELTLLLGQLQNTVDNKLKFVEGQILGQSKKGVPPELIKEFKETFIYFDKDASNTLDRLEFKACVQSLGISLPREDAAYDEVFQGVTQGQPEVTFDQFVDYMVKITEDTDTAAQIKQSFKVLANEQNSVAFGDLYIAPLQESEVEYLKHHLSGRDAGEGRFNYADYVDSVFAPQ